MGDIPKSYMKHTRQVGESVWMFKAARYFYFIVVLLLLFSSSLYARELYWSIVNAAFQAPASDAGER